MPLGFNGQILRVDLTKRRIDVEKPDEIFYRKYFGGRNMASYYLLKELQPRVDPLSPENILIFAASPITGVPVPGVCRYSVASKSPLTGAYGESEAGGFWGPELKFAGYDAIIVRGKASDPAYLWVHDGQAEIRDAAHLWGKTTGETQENIRKELGDSLVRVATIGPAGENLVRYACVLNELKHANGRTGMGAVMGSKNLKAIAVRGHKKVEMKDPDGVLEIGKWFSENYIRNEINSLLQDTGTSGGVVSVNEIGLLPTRNFREGYFEAAESISGQKMKENILVGREGCYACPVRCKRVVASTDTYTIDPNYGGPEYETVAALGSNCGISDLSAVAKGNELCNKYGMDTISTGVTIGFAMECYERGFISKDETGGIELRFGNSEAMVKLVEMIALRKGFGDLLAEGVMRASDRIGKGSEKFAVHVKGQEAPMQEPRGKVGTGIGYAVSPTGADHTQAEADNCFASKTIFLEHLYSLGILEPVDPLDLGPRKIRLFIHLQLLWSFYQSSGICIFVGAPGRTFPLNSLIRLVKAVTGWETSAWELMKVGERGVNLTRCFNIREGFTRKDDWLPDRFFEPLEGGPLSGQKISREEFQRALSDYYEMMGWNRDTGMPAISKLEELDIGWANPET